MFDSLVEMVFQDAIATWVQPSNCGPSPPLGTVGYCLDRSSVHERLLLASSLDSRSEARVQTVLSRMRNHPQSPCGKGLVRGLGSRPTPARSCALEVLGRPISARIHHQEREIGRQISRTDELASRFRTERSEIDRAL